MSEGIFRGSAISGNIVVPGSKHLSQRYILLSAFSGIPVEITNLSFSDDESVAVGIAKAAGSIIETTPAGMKITPSFSCPDSICAGESGTSFRMALGLLAARGCRTAVNMHKSLMRRSSADLFRTLEDCGAAVTVTGEGILLDAGRFKTGRMEVRGDTSSQFVSSLLMLLAVSGGSSRTLTVSGRRVSQGYIGMTEQCLSQFGISVSERNGTYLVSGTLKRPQKPIELETDMSSLSAIIVFAVMCSGEGITVSRVNSGSTQPDRIFPGQLAESGFKVRINDACKGVFAAKGVGKHLTVDADTNPDLAVTAAPLGIFSDQGLTLLNTSRLSEKESDRRAEVIFLARSFGANVEVSGDTIEISRGKKHSVPEKLQFKDHRMVMAAITCAIASGGSTVIGDLDTLNKSFPSFIRLLESVGVELLRP